MPVHLLPLSRIVEGRHWSLPDVASKDIFERLLLRRFSTEALARTAQSCSLPLAGRVGEGTIGGMITQEILAQLKGTSLILETKKGHH
jgi:hypothetical protein